jgi:signal transduction histidine kinase
MNHEKLEITHKNLSILFTLIVCLIVFVLGFSTLSAKYYNELRLQKWEFERSAGEIRSLLSSQNMALRQLFFNQILEGESIEERFGRGRRDIQSNLSFLVINAQNQLIFENILEDVDFWLLSIPPDSEVYLGNGILYQMLPVHPRYGSSILFYQKIRYTIDDFLRDILLLLIVVFIFSYLVYFLWNRFVWRALKPVEQNLDDMQDFIHNAGHELKTPLAVMRGNLQVMQAEHSFDQELLSKSLSQIDHMNQLIESLRELSELGTLRTKESLHLRTEVTRIIELLSATQTTKNITLHNNLQDGFYLSAHPYELEVFFGNILKNAFLYNQMWGTVTLTQKKNIVEIRDTGKGIPESEQDKIFERFYRGDQARNAQEWLWVGLSLVKKIADTNGWKLEVESELWKGTVFRIIF